MSAERTSQVDGRSTRWIAHRVQRRAALLERARAALPTTGADVAMDDLAAAMGTSKSILYRYFVDRSGLREALAEEVTRNLLEELPSGDATRDPSEEGRRNRLENAVHHFLRAVATEPELYLFVSAGASAEASRAAAQVTDGAAQGPAGGAVHTDPDPSSGEGNAPDPGDSPYEWTTLRSLGPDFTELPQIQQAAAVGALRGACVRWLAEARMDGAGEVALEEGIAGLASDLARWIADGIVENAEGTASTEAASDGPTV